MMEHSNSLETRQPDCGIKFTEKQQSAITLIESCSKRVVTIAGYAGTGKTTLVYEAMCRIRRKHEQWSIAFACYTGKAAQVLSDKLQGADVCTTHKLLYNTMSRDVYNSDEYQSQHPYVEGTLMGGEFVHVPKKRIDADVVVIDELSMLPTKILGQLLSHEEVKYFVLLGDPAQLPPVSKADELLQMKLLCKADVTLTEVMRQGEGSYLLWTAMWVRDQHRMPLFPPMGQKEVFALPASDIKKIIGRYVDNIERDPQNTENITFLVHSNRIRYNLNYYIHHLLYPEEKYHKFNDRAPEYYPTLHEGERIICTENDYSNESNLENHIINGTVGIMTGASQMVSDDLIREELRRINAITENMPKTAVQELIERERVYQYQLTHYRQQRAREGRNGSSVYMPETWKGIVRPDLTLAYALTVHKAQGSEYQHVVILEEHSLWWQCQSNDEMEQYYRWIYTAITRARRSVTIIKGKIAPHLYALWRDMDPEYIKKQEQLARAREREAKKKEKTKTITKTKNKKKK